MKKYLVLAFTALVFALNPIQAKAIGFCAITDGAPAQTTDKVLVSRDCGGTPSSVTVPLSSVADLVAGVSDADYGDVVVSGSGAVWSLDSTISPVFNTLNLNGATNQLVLDADGSFTGILSMSALSSNRTWTMPNSTGTVALISNTANISNKTLNNTNTINLNDESFTLEDDADGTKVIDFELSGLTTSTTRTITVPDKSGTLAMTSDLGGVSDGDKGDVTVSGGGAAWTIDNGVVTLDKQADVAGTSFLGRSSGSTGVPQRISMSSARTMLNVEDGSTADQTDSEIETAYNNQVSIVSQAEAEAGTATTARRWTAQRVGQAIAALGGGYTPSMITVGVNNAQDVTSASPTAIDFNTEDIKDTGFTHSTVTNPSRITVDAAGRYRVEGYISVTGTTSNYRYSANVGLRVNGVTSRNVIESGYIRASTGSNQTALIVYDILDLSANDYIEVMVARTTTTVGNATTIANKTLVSVEKLD